MTVLEDSDSEEWSSHYFPSASGSTAGKGGKKGGYKKVIFNTNCLYIYG